MPRVAGPARGRSAGRFFDSTLFAAPAVGVVFHGGNAKEFQKEAAVDIGETEAEGLGGVSLLTDHGPGDNDFFHLALSATSEHIKEKGRRLISFADITFLISEKSP